MARATRRAIVVALGSAVSIACLTSFPDLRDGPAANDAGADVLIEAVYWTSQGAVPASDGSVSRAPKSGGSATVIASGLDSPWMMAADATHVYWTSLRAGTVHRVAKTGGTSEQLATPVDSTPSLIAAWGIVVHEGFVYWRENDLLRRVRAGGGNAETLLAAKPNGRFVAIDGDQLVWTAHVPTLQTIETATVSELAAAQVTIVSTAAGIAPHGAAIDSTFIYWTAWGTSSAALDGAVYKIARP